MDIYMERLAIALGKNIRRHRMARGFSQEELSDRAAIHYTYLGHIERGTRLPSMSTPNRIAKALAVSLSELCKNVG
jgi:transcriptional regulator with XRE-family HTH domain